MISELFEAVFFAEQLEIWGLGLNGRGWPRSYP